MAISANRISHIEAILRITLEDAGKYKNALDRQSDQEWELKNFKQSADILIERLNSLFEELGQENKL